MKSRMSKEKAMKRKKYKKTSESSVKRRMSSMMKKMMMILSLIGSLQRITKKRKEIENIFDYFSRMDLFVFPEKKES